MPLSQASLSASLMSTFTCSMGQTARLLSTSKALWECLLWWVPITLIAIAWASSLFLVTLNFEFVQPLDLSHFCGSSLLHTLYIFLFPFSLTRLILSVSYFWEFFSKSGLLLLDLFSLWSVISGL